VEFAAPIAAFLLVLLLLFLRQKSLSLFGSRRKKRLWGSRKGLFDFPHIPQSLPKSLKYYFCHKKTLMKKMAFANGSVVEAKKSLRGTRKKKVQRS
jgi:hypothetical protein